MKNSCNEKQKTAMDYYEQGLAARRRGDLSEAMGYFRKADDCNRDNGFHYDITSEIESLNEIFYLESTVSLDVLETVAARIRSGNDPASTIG